MADIKQFTDLMTAGGLLVTAVTGIVALFKIQKVHYLVNSEMALFRTEIRERFEAERAGVFRDGQQQVRDTNRGLTLAAAGATSDAAKATVAAADATVEAAKGPKSST